MAALWIFVAVALGVISASASFALSPTECAPACSCTRTRMSCAGKGLSALPEGSWPNVRMLDVSGNALTSLQGLGQRFPALLLVLARENKLTTLDLGVLAGPDAPPALMAADLSHNAIDKVQPLQAGSAANRLALLYLGHNRLSQLAPDAFLQLVSLQHLSLNDNPLTLAPGRPLLQHPALQALDLARVNLQSLQGGLARALGHLPALADLSLQGCGIDRIDRGAFATLQRLDDLYLQDNRISRISADMFAPSAALSELHLEGNPLNTVDGPSLPVKAGGELHIEETTLACSCGYAELARWAAQRGVKLMASCRYSVPCFFADL